MKSYTVAKKGKIRATGVEKFEDGSVVAVASKDGMVRGVVSSDDVKDGKINVMIIGEENGDYLVVYNATERFYGFVPMVVVIPKYDVELS